MTDEFFTELPYGPLPLPIPGFLASLEPEAIRGLGNICPACLFHQ